MNGKSYYQKSTIFHILIELHRGIILDISMVWIYDKESM